MNRSLLFQGPDSQSIVLSYARFHCHLALIICSEDHNHEADDPPCEHNGESAVQFVITYQNKISV